MKTVGTGVPDGPTPTRQELLSGLYHSRTVEDAGPYEFDLFVGFKQPDKLQFSHFLNITLSLLKSLVSTTTNTPAVMRLAATVRMICMGS